MLQRVLSGQVSRTRRCASWIIRRVTSARTIREIAKSYEISFLVFLRAFVHLLSRCYSHVYNICLEIVVSRDRDCRYRTISLDFIELRNSVNSRLIKRSKARYGKITVENGESINSFFTCSLANIFCARVHLREIYYARETLHQRAPLFLGSLSSLLIFDYRPPNASDVFGLKTTSIRCAHRFSRAPAMR